MAKIDLKIDELLAGLEERLRRLEVSVAEELAGTVRAVAWQGEALCDLVRSAYGGYYQDQPYTPTVLPETEVEPGVWLEAEALEMKIIVMIRVQSGLRQEQKLVSVSKEETRFLCYPDWQHKLQDAYRWCVLAIGQQRRLAMDRLLEKRV